MALDRERHRDWSHLEPGVVSRVVAAVRRNKRWHYDGPSLRRLNRYWASQMDQSIVSVCPHQSRRLTPKDADSLFKFPRLSKLDPCPFLPDDASNEHKQAVIGVITRLRTLSSLVLTPWCRLFTSDVWSQLTGVTHLACRRRVSCRLVSDEVIQTSRYPSPSSFDVWDVGTVSPLVQSLPQLKTLEAELVELESLEDVDAFSNLQSLKLTLHKTCRSVALLTELSSLKELELLNCPVEYLELLEPLQSLRYVSLRDLDVSPHLNDAWWGIAARLTSLDLRAARAWRALGDTVFRDAVSLESLTLWMFQLRGRPLLQQLTALKALTLRECCMLDELDVVKVSNTLQRLALVNIVDRARELVELPFDEAELPEIRSLELSSTDGEATLREIVRWTTLEDVQIGVAHGITVDGIRELAKLPKLRHLEFTLSHGATLVAQLLSLDFVQRLETLSFVGRPVTIEEKAQIEAYAETIRQQSRRQRIAYQV